MASLFIQKRHLDGKINRFLSRLPRKNLVKH
jgi:hypothetical protein